NEKIGLNPVNVGDLKLVLEEDGTEVDQDYLPFIEANTILMLLSTNELWSDRKGMSAVNQSGQKENIAESLNRPTQYTLTSNLTLGNPIMDDIATSTTNTMGKLLDKAKETTVISQGYEFVKGKSRARSLSDIDSAFDFRKKSKSQPSVEEAEDHSPDLFSQQEETGNQTPDMFSQQEETGNQSPDMFSQQEETGNQSPDMFSQQEEM
ncbi:cell death activator CIDE-A-like, partial [Paramuricea clavata]